MPRRAPFPLTLLDDIDRFHMRHRVLLLRYLDGKAPASPAEPDAQRYVAQVLDEWSRLCARRRPRRARPSERTFWYALYQLDVLTEAPVANGRVEPFDGPMLEDLARVRELLRAGRALPDGWFASCPGEAC
jgi:hypothetical protein